MQVLLVSEPAFLYAMALGLRALPGYHIEDKMSRLREQTLILYLRLVSGTRAALGVKGYAEDELEEQHLVVVVDLVFDMHYHHIGSKEGLFKRWTC